MLSYIRQQISSFEAKAMPRSEMKGYQPCRFVIQIESLFRSLIFQQDLALFWIAIIHRSSCHGVMKEKKLFLSLKRRTSVHDSIVVALELHVCR